MSFYQQFRATVGEDQVIRLPEGLVIPPGEYSITLTTPIRLPEPASSDADDPDPMAGTRKMLLEIAAEAEALELDDLPTDMAENHDHYAHGAPKR
jgi:hypothetical protein